MDVRLPDGTLIQGVPDNMTRAELVTKLQGNGMAVPAEWLQASAPAPAPTPEKSVWQRGGEWLNREINNVPRQLGLAARYALEGPAQAAQIVTEPVAGLMRMAGVPTKSVGQLATDAADAMGLPSPRGAQENIIGGATRMLAGGGGMLGAARGAAQLPGMAGVVGQGMSAAPLQQLGGAMGAGGAAEASREAGGGPGTQLAAALLGGVAGSVAVGPAVRQAENLVGRMRGTSTPPAPITPQSIDAQINITLERAGVDPTDITDTMRRSLRAEMGDAMRAGREVNPDALRRLADFRTTGITPTRGMLSQDPVQITREQNLAKIAAASADGELHGLPRMQNANNATMIRNMTDLGAGRADAFGVGQRAQQSILAQDEALGSGVRGAYDNARGIAGADIALERKPIIDGIYNELARQNKMAFLPENIGRMLNDISRGVTRVGDQTFDVPFTPQVVDNLKTMMATASRGTQDGNQRAALSIARQVLEDAPFNVVRPPAAPGQLVPLAQAGAGPAARGANEAAAPYMSALNDARGLARERFAWQDSSRPVRDVLNGAQPDNLFRTNVLSGTVEDTRQFMRYAGEQQTRDTVLGYLRDSALSNQADEVGKFSSSAFNRALQRIGDRKLEAIFEPDQLAQLRALGRASSYAQAQPVGSAVNNSNSGALVLGRGADMLGSLAKRVPGGQMLIADPLFNINVGLSQRQAQNLAPALMRPTERISLGGRTFAPAATYGGVFAGQD